jgi:hypothetical protein
MDAGEKMEVLSKNEARYEIEGEKVENLCK